MGMFIGFHAEGWDYLILKALLARLLSFPEEDIAHDHPIDVSGRGFDFVLANIPSAITKFYRLCAQGVVIGIDNDGDEIVHAADQEDPRRPRHWNHLESGAPECRVCRVNAAIERARSRLTALPEKPPETWPVLTAVPVEAIEAWILELQAIVDPPRGLVRAENHRRSGLKTLLYGKGAATQQDVTQIALPLVRAASLAHLAEFRQRSQSFDLFAAQVERNRALLLGARDCWGPGDQGAER